MADAGGGGGDAAASGGAMEVSTSAAAAVDAENHDWMGAYLTWSGNLLKKVESMWPAYLSNRSDQPNPLCGDSPHKYAGTGKQSNTEGELKLSANLKGSSMAASGDGTPSPFLFQSIEWSTEPATEAKDQFRPIASNGRFEKDTSNGGRLGSDKSDRLVVDLLPEIQVGIWKDGVFTKALSGSKSIAQHLPMGAHGDGFTTGTLVMLQDHCAQMIGPMIALEGVSWREGSDAAKSFGAKNTIRCLVLFPHQYLSFLTKGSKEREPLFFVNVKPSYLHPVSVVDAVNGILETVDLYGDVWPTFLFPEFPDSDQINAYNTEHPQGPANPRVVSSYTNFLNGALGRGNPEILLGVLEHILKKKPSVGSKLTRKTPAEVRAALVDPDADFFPPEKMNTLLLLELRELSRGTLTFLHHDAAWFKVIQDKWQMIDKELQVLNAASPTALVTNAAQCSAVKKALDALDGSALAPKESAAVPPPAPTPGGAAVPAPRVARSTALRSKGVDGSIPTVSIKSIVKTASAKVNGILKAASAIETGGGSSPAVPGDRTGAPPPASKEAATEKSVVLVPGGEVLRHPDNSLFSSSDGSENEEEAEPLVKENEVPAPAVAEAAMAAVGAAVGPPALGDTPPDLGTGGISDEAGSSDVSIENHFVGEMKRVRAESAKIIAAATELKDFMLPAVSKFFKDFEAATNFKRTTGGSYLHKQYLGEHRHGLAVLAKVLFAEYGQFVAEREKGKELIEKLEKELESCRSKEQLAASEAASAEAALAKEVPAKAKEVPAKDQPKEGVPKASVVYMLPVEEHFEQLSKYHKKKAKESKKVQAAKVPFPDTFDDGMKYCDALHRLLDNKDCAEKMTALQEAKSEIELLQEQYAQGAFKAPGERGKEDIKDLKEVVATHKDLTLAFEKYEKAIPEIAALELGKREQKQLQNDMRKLEDANETLREDKEELHKTIRSFAKDGAKEGGASAGGEPPKNTFSSDDVLKFVAGMSGVAPGMPAMTPIEQMMHRQQHQHQILQQQQQQQQLQQQRHMLGGSGAYAAQESHAGGHGLGMFPIGTSAILDAAAPPPDKKRPLPPGPPSAFKYVHSAYAAEGQNLLVDESVPEDFVWSCTPDGAEYAWRDPRLVGDPEWKKYDGPQAKKIRKA